jgi:pyruvate,water dikinase
MEIVKEAKRAEGIFGRPIDMEFAIENNVVYFLQARPITTIDCKDIIILDNSNIVESYPGLSLPLTQDYVKTIYHEIFYNLLVRVTRNKKCIDSIDWQLKDMVDVANWRMYYRISNWYSVLQLMPFSNKVIPMWQKMMGVEDKSLEIITPFKVSFGVKMQIIHSVLKYMRTIPSEMKGLNEKFEQKVVEYERKILNADTISALLQVYETIRADILQDWDLTLINDMYTFIYCHLSKKKYGNLIADIKNIESMKPAIEMKNLLFIAKESGVDSDEYVSASNKYIAEYGDRCVGELKLETKTYRTNPELLDEYVINTLQNNPTGLTIASMRNGEIKTTKDPKVVRKAKIGIANRESSRLNRSRLFGICRLIFLKIGQIMYSANRIEKPEDVFYLHINELRMMKDHKQLVSNRKLEEVAFESIPAYSRLIFPGQVINKTNPIVERKILGEENHLCGTATSSGVATGQVVIIKDVNKPCDLKNKIIVTTSTDPGWVFLVQQCAGIISEKGSLLSHTAIISRELHKPAVVNVKNCTKILRDGDVVQLDANNGVITIIERGRNEI